MGEKHKAEPASNIENRLRGFRVSRGLSQANLAESAGVSRQAVCAIEANHYLPMTAVALRLAGVLGCRVEDLFNLRTTGEVIEGKLIGNSPACDRAHTPIRVKVAHIGDRFVVRPVTALGELLTYTVPADGLLMAPIQETGVSTSPGYVRTQLLRERRVIEQEISVAGCDPAIFLAGEYLRRYKDTATVVCWTMGSTAALQALQRREVHMAGLHIVDSKTGESNLPYLRQHLRGGEHLIVTFAAWEEGFIVQHRNPKSIRRIEDLLQKGVTFVNREDGSGARLLLDHKLADGGITGKHIRGYDVTAASHFQIARLVAEGRADVGMGIRSAANIFGLDFVPLQESRYDLVIPKTYLTSHPTLGNLLDTIVSRQFRTEIEAFGGYDTRETGTIRNLRDK